MKCLVLFSLPLLGGCAILDSLGPEGVQNIGNAAGDTAALFFGYPAKLIAGGVTAIVMSYFVIKKGEDKK